MKKNIIKITSLFSLLAVIAMGKSDGNPPKTSTMNSGLVESGLLK